MSLRQAAQKAWKGTKKLQAKTMGQLQARSVQMRKLLMNNRARVDFALRLRTWAGRQDTRGVAARFLLATMPKLLQPAMTMTIRTAEDAKHIHSVIANWSKHERMGSRDMKLRWERALRFISQDNSSEGNTVQLFADGSPAFQAMWHSIRQAKHRVWLTTYILKPDAVAFRMIEELTNAARRGVQVAFIYDHFGSLGFSDSHFDHLRAAGGMVLCFNSLRSIADFFKFDFRRDYVLYRNHRKILVVDHDVGYCGGMNIAVDYCGEDIGGNGRFRDTHAKIVGPGVRHLAEVFLSTLQTMQAQKVPIWADVMKMVHKKAEELGELEPSFVSPNEPLPSTSTSSVIATNNSNHNSSQSAHSQTAPNNTRAVSVTSVSPVVEQLVPRRRSLAILPLPVPTGTFLQVLSSNSRENKVAIQKTLSEIIDLAQKHVYLTSPYFLPPPSLRKAIIRAARRGVDVRILTAGKSDIYLITSASAHIYGLFLRNGVRVYELQNKELHAKTITSDGAVAMVGSYNLDNLSYKHNLEATLNLVDSKLAVQFERQFFEDLKYSKEIIKSSWENRSWIKRAWHWMVYTVFRFLLR